MQANGSWSDVDYKDEGRSLWKAADHWTRLDTMAKAHQCPKCNSSVQNSSAILATIHRGIAFWSKYDF